MRPLPEDMLDSPEAEAQWQWLSGTLRATEPKIDLTAVAAGVRGKLRRRRLRILSMAAGLLVAVGLVGWQLNRASLFSAAPQDRRIVTANPPTHVPPSAQANPYKTSTRLRTTIIVNAHRWQDDLDRQLASMQREIWRVRGSSRRLPSDADLIRGDLKQFELAIRRSTL